MTETLSHIALWLAGLTTLMAAEWCVAYGRLSHGGWRRSQVGWHLMTFMAVRTVRDGSTFMILYQGLVVRQLAPAWMAWAWVGSYALEPVVIGWRRVILWQVQQAAWRESHGGRDGWLIGSVNRVRGWTRGQRHG